VPDDMDDEIAAQIFITTLTVVGMVETAAVPKVLVTTMHAIVRDVFELLAAVFSCRLLHVEPIKQCS
jgi:hypothetical protein